eukprot:m.223520 g.223520  ORF g.223520 m.223520 type:complete len:59 (-) comp26346_c0_seq12:1395-1571(-)
MLLYEFYFVQTIAQIPPCFLALPGSKNTKEVSTEMHQPMIAASFTSSCVRQRCTFLLH